MSIIYVLIPIAMLFTLIALCLFVWAARKGQFDDLERHGRSILFDDAKPPSSPTAAPRKHDDGA